MLNNKEYLKKLASSLYFEMDEKQLDKLASQFDNLQKDVEMIKNFDTKDLLPTNFCLAESFNSLREDIVIEDKNDHLKNADKVIEGYVVVK